MTWGFAFPQHKYLNMIVEYSSEIFHRAFIYVSHNSIFTVVPQIHFTVVPQIPIHLCKQNPLYSKTFLMKIKVRMCYLLLLYYKHIIKTKTFFIR